MSAARPPIEAFRKRLIELLHQRFEGKYTVLAHRSGIPVSSMQHYMHTAKHLPGGEHLQRMADALSVTTDFLLSGTQTVLPSDLFSKPIQVVKSGAGDLERQVSVPVFRCTCPKECSFGEDVPPVDKAKQRMVIPTDMVASHHYHRLIGVLLDGHLRNCGLGANGRAVIDWDDRAPNWEHVMFYFDGAHHQCGRIKATDGGLMIMDEKDSPTLLPKTAQILGRVVAVLSTP